MTQRPKPSKQPSIYRNDVANVLTFDLGLAAAFPRCSDRFSSFSPSTRALSPGRCSGEHLQMTADRA